MTVKSTFNHDRERKYTLRLAVFLVVVGCALLIAGFIVPPSGEIHSSALVAFGEIMTFVAALLGINSHYISIISKLKSTDGSLLSAPDKRTSEA
jgi:hypothetical protein